MTLRELDPRRALAWMCTSLGLAPVRRADELIGVFEPGALPTRPSVYP